jgi:hypothetical protein
LTAPHCDRNLREVVRKQTAAILDVAVIEHPYQPNSPNTSPKHLPDTGQKRNIARE